MRSHAKWKKGSTHGDLEMISNPWYVTNEGKTRKYVLCRCNLCTKEYQTELSNFKKATKCRDCRGRLDRGKPSKLKIPNLPDENGYKICRKCNKNQPIENYNCSGYHKDNGGKSVFCKKCARIRKYKHMYGLSFEEYIQILEEQNYKCKVCGITEEELGKYLCVDHCHSSGKIRGILCGNCNTALGFAKDSIYNLKKMIEYLEEYKNDSQRS